MSREVWVVESKRIDGWEPWCFWHVWDEKEAREIAKLHPDTRRVVRYIPEDEKL